MLKIYDKSHTAAGYIKAYKDLKIESVASTGDKTLSFTYLGRKIIEPEYYIQTQTEEYVIKEKSHSADGFPQYVAILNLEELEGKAWSSFSVKESTIDEAARLALAGTGWTIGGCDVKKKRNAGMLQVTSKDIIENLATAFLCEIVYDTKKKTVSFYNETGEDKGTYFIRGLNLKKLDRKEDSYDYYTQIIPIGANDLTIEKVNDGKKYLENYQYSNKVKTYIWKDESYTDAQALKEDAELKLQDLSRPVESYSVTVLDLAKQKKQYSILEYHVGDKIWLIDSMTRTRVKQRIVKMTEYPQEPDRNTCEIANTVLTFEELASKYKAAAEIVNTVVAGDGRYTGTISVSDILNFEKGLSDSDVVSGIINNIDSLNGSVKDIKLTVGSLDTNYLKVEDAELKYATIEKLDTVSENVKDLSAKYADVENLKTAHAEFEDATAKHFEANEAKIKELDTEKLSVKDADIKFANIDFSNIKMAAIEQFFSKSGIIENIVIGDASITGELVGVTISGSLIKGDTIVAEKLVVRGEDGLYYKLNTDGMTVEKEQTDYNSLNGQIIKAKSITATKIDVKDLVAFGATIGGFKIGSDSLYSGVKESVDNTTRGIYMDTDGQYAIGDASQYIKFYRVSDGKYKLAIAVEDLRIGLTNASDAFNEMDDIKDELVTSLVIESSNGISFDSDTAPAILKVAVYYGRTRITDNDQLVKTFGSEIYLEWSCKGSNDEDWTQVSSEDERISDNGFTFFTTKEDLFNQTTFKCCLIGSEHDTLNPDQETVVDRLTSRLQKYVDETLMADVRENFESVKNEVLTEISKDTYVSRIETNEKNIANLQKVIEDLQYAKIEILSFTCDKTIVELGSAVTETTFSWQTNKKPTALTLDDETMNIKLTSYKKTGLNCSSRQAFTLKATDDRNAEASKTVYIDFHNGVYFGTTEIPDNIDSEFIMTLQKTLQSTKLKSFNTVTNENMYIWYALPTRYGTPVFNVGGFDGGFTKIVTIDFTNASGYTEKYDVYRSDNSNLGTKTVKVS